MLINVLRSVLRSLIELGKSRNAPARAQSGELVSDDLPVLLDRARSAHRDGSLDEALSAYECALKLLPEMQAEARAAVVVNMGVILSEQVRLPQAIARLREAIVICPRVAITHYNLGLYLYEMGESNEAEAALKTAIEIEPGFQAAHSTLLCLYGFTRSENPERVLLEHRRWAGKFADPLTAKAPAHSNDRSTVRRLTVGYVSADFKEHSLARFISPILANHDHQRFRVICYDNWSKSDATTERLRAYADAWRKIDTLNDDQVAALVRADGVDILVDLSGHTTGNRLMMFARKPAPVQASWMGYMCTTGMTAMDWRITDANLDPPGISEAWYAERLMRIDCAVAFEPHPGSPPVNQLPAHKNGFVRFGSFNNYTKIGDEVVAMWSRMLAALPEARLMLVTLGGDDPQIKAAICARFERLTSTSGVSKRVEVTGRRSPEDFLRMFHQVDIALDPFPYSGGTTSLHTLWMGVPIVSIEGNTELARSTSGMLKACGLHDLVAHGEEEYLKIGVALATDLGRLAELRASIRQRLAKTSLGDGQRVTQNLEDGYRAMWAEFARSAR